MARELELTCPSGLRVRLRGIKGKDLDGLRDKRRVASGEAIGTLLDDCTLEVLDRAIYEKLPTFSWQDALIGDRTKAIVSLREATSGGTYDFRIRCRDRDCRQMIDWTVELNQLEIKALPPESAAAFLAGNVFETTVNGAVVKYRLNTGRDQTKLVKLVSQLNSQISSSQREHQRTSTEGRALLGLAARIISVEGVDKIMDWLDELDLSDISDLTATMDKVDCGVETTIEILCSGNDGCGLRQEVELPLDSTFFSRPV